MATLVTFHAHPDDESIATGGTMAKAAAAGHRVVLVLATKGEHGEVADGFLDPGEEIWERRVAETHRAADLLGVQRVAFLGYVDSGMMGRPTNDAPGSFWEADTGEAAARLATILDEEGADVLTIYDDMGTYGHPDHIQVHRVGVLAAERAGTPRVYEATANRDDVRRALLEAREGGLEMPGGLDPDNLESFGQPEALITTAVDVSGFIDAKRAAMAAHASQIDETSFFLAMPPDAFARAFGTEWYIRRGVAAGTRETDLFG